jgi:hypothetical protein
LVCLGADLDSGGKGKLKPDSYGIVIINPLTDRYGPATQVPIEKRVGRAAGCGLKPLEQGTISEMISLNDGQLTTVMTAASHVPIEKRDTLAAHRRHAYASRSRAFRRPGCRRRGEAGAGRNGPRKRGVIPNKYVDDFELIGLAQKRASAMERPTPRL